MAELGEVIRDAVQGKAGLDALAALMSAFRACVTAHPGRWRWPLRPESGTTGT